MKTNFYKFNKNDYSFLLIPIIGVNKNDNEKSIIIGWLFWGFEIII